MTIKLLTLKEYSKEPEVFVCETVQECSVLKERISVLSSYWKSKLGLPFLPIEVTSSDKKSLSLWAKGVTGFIKIEDLNIEISPKFLEKNHGDDSWRTALTTILILTNQQTLIDRQHTHARKTNSFLADFMADRYLYSLNNAILKGFPRVYCEQQGNLPFLRGKLDVSRITQVYQHPYYLPCVYDEYTEDTTLNRLLKWAAIELSKVVVSTKISRTLSEVSSYFKDVSFIKPGILEAENLRLPPQYSYLEESLSIAKLVLKSESLEHGTGNQILSGFLWNSSSVYEKLVKLIIKSVCKLNRFFTFSDASIHLATPINNLTSIFTSPDARILEAGHTKYVLDAKYKQWHNRPKAEDTYQVIAGARAASCRFGILIYPVEAQKDALIWVLNNEGLPHFIAAIFINLNQLTTLSRFKGIVSKLNQDLIELEQVVAKNEVKQSVLVV